jgi:hypothetical protein
MLKQIVENGEESRCAGLLVKCERILMKIIGCMAPFQIKTGRWQGVKREDRLYKECMRVERGNLRCGGRMVIKGSEMECTRTDTDEACPPIYKGEVMMTQ